MAATSLALASGGVAFADIVTNSIASTSAGKVLQVHAGGSASVSYTIKNENENDGDQKSCNPADKTGVTINALGAPTGVTANAPTATDCVVNAATVTFHAARTAVPGDYTITHSFVDAGGGRYVDQAGFTLKVLAPLNGAPQVSVTGVANGAAYDFGSVPTAGCSVTDAEDGTKSPAATLSVMSGKLGSQTASCSYTDNGGLTGSASATYSIVDTTAPSVSVPAINITREATAASTPVSWSASATDLVDGSLTPTCSPNSGSGFAVGSTTVTCSAKDAAGNNGSASFAVVVNDTTAPALTVPSAVTKAATSASGAVVEYSGASAVDLVDGVTAVSCTPASGTLFRLGTTPVTCSTKDSRNNPASDSFNVKVQDEGKPVVTVPANQKLEATSGAGAAYTFSSSATDDVDSDVATTCDSTSGRTFPLGATPVTCTATDAAGNTGSSSFTVTVEDTTGPKLHLPSSVSREATVPDGAEATWTATAQDLVDGEVRVTCEPASGSTFALGETTVSCSASDKAGNRSGDDFTVTVKDTTKPTMPTLTDIAAVEATGPDGAPVDYTVGKATDLVDGELTLSCDPLPGSTFGLDTTPVTCTATDKSGNAQTGTFKVTVVDTTKPQVKTSVNLTEEASSSAGALVRYAAATATDAVSGTPAANCSPASGTRFPMGTTTVTCTAKDAAGNTGSGQFTIKVQDTGKPDVHVPGAMTVEATSASGASAVYGTVSARDAIDGELDTICSAASGDVFPLGDTTVTCTATDLSGNEGSNSFKVTVSDTTAPRISVSADLRATASSSAGAPVSFTAPSASDLVDGAVTATCDRASGSTFPAGTTTVKCTATDKAGNKAEKTFTVSVTYGWAGAYNAPISNDGKSVHRLGSTVPVKFHLTGASASIGDLVVPLKVNGTTVGLYRYDPTAPQYIYNLSTKGMTAGTHKVTTNLGDGAGDRLVLITLR